LHVRQPAALAGRAGHDLTNFVVIMEAHQKHESQIMKCLALPRAAVSCGSAAMPSSCGRRFLGSLYRCK